jgi:hypothetical protein
MSWLRFWLLVQHTPCSNLLGVYCLFLHYFRDFHHSSRASLKSSDTPYHGDTLVISTTMVLTNAAMLILTALLTLGVNGLVSWSSAWSSALLYALAILINPLIIMRVVTIASNIIVLPNSLFISVLYISTWHDPQRKSSDTSSLLTYTYAKNRYGFCVYCLIAKTSLFKVSTPGSRDRYLGIPFCYSAISE